MYNATALYNIVHLMAVEVDYDILEASYVGLQLPTAVSIGADLHMTQRLRGRCTQEP